MVDKTELEMWQSLVGWDQNVATICASPLWVDEQSLSEHLFWLFDQSDEPRCLSILDFDLGFVDGYLAPFLKAWRLSGVFSPWKKILVFPSSDN